METNGRVPGKRKEKSKDLRSPSGNERGDRYRPIRLNFRQP